MEVNLNYNKEDLRFYHMRRMEFNGHEIFEIEDELNTFQKIIFIDNLYDGLATYIFNLHVQWGEDFESLPKNPNGTVKAQSFRSWIRRNDTRGILHVEHKEYLGDYRMNLRTYNIKQSTSLQSDTRRHPFGGMLIANLWFHDLCHELYNKEVQYFQEHDPFHQKLKRVFKYGEQYGHNFGEHKLSMLIWNHHMVKELWVTEYDLDRYIAAYERVEALVKQIGAEWASEGIPMDEIND